MSTSTEVQVAAREIRPGDEIKFGPGPLIGIRWQKVLRHSAAPESTNQATDRVGFTIAVPSGAGVQGGTSGYYVTPTTVHTIRRHTTAVPSIWALVTA